LFAFFGHRLSVHVSPLLRRSVFSNLRNISLQCSAMLLPDRLVDRLARIVIGATRTIDTVRWQLAL
jgi:hypothetical protein